MQIGYTLTQITFVDTKNGAVNGNGYFIQHKVKHGMIAEYCHNTHTLSSVISNFGVEFRNWEQVMTKLQGQHVFITRKISGQLLEAGSFWRAAIALVPHLEMVYGAWDYITGHTTQPLHSTEHFDKTYEEQLARYDGKVIRGIVGDFSDYTLRNEGHFANTEGAVYLTGFLLTWSYRGTAHHNL